MSGPTRRTVVTGALAAGAVAVLPEPASAAQVAGEVRLRIGAMMPKWFHGAMEASRILPMPGWGMHWGWQGAMVETPVGLVHAKIGDTVLRMGDGTLRVRPAA